jgi:transcriptional regulator with XRE-family HTH domain
MSLHHTAGSPIAARRQRGAELRRLREQTGKSADAIARAMAWSPSKICRYEGARTVPVPAEVDKLLGYYQITGTRHDHLLALAQAASGTGWWDHHTADIPASQREFIGLEHAATTILIWQAHLIPPLLQTPAYARHLAHSLRHVEPIPPQQATRRAAVTIARQQLLDRDSPPAITAVLDEAILRCPAGDAQVRQGQLAHLASGHPAITVHVLPLTCAQPVYTGSFTLLSFGPTAGDVLPDVVALDHLTSTSLVDDERQAYVYRLAFHRLAAPALDPAQSRSLIHKLSGLTPGHPPAARPWPCDRRAARPGTRRTGGHRTSPAAGLPRCGPAAGLPHPCHAQHSRPADHRPQ